MPSMYLNTNLTAQETGVIVDVILQNYPKHLRSKHV